MPFIKIPQRVLVHPKSGMPYYSTRQKRIFSSGDSIAQHLRFQDLAMKSLEEVDYVPILEKLKSNFADSLFTKTFISLQAGQEEGTLLVNTRTNTLVAIIITSGDKKIVPFPMIADDRDLQTIKSFVQTRLGGEESAIQKFQSFLELEKARPGLIQRKVPVKRDGKLFYSIRWVRPERLGIFGEKGKHIGQISPENLMYFEETFDDMPQEGRQGAIKLLEFIDGYAELALKGKDFPNEKLNDLYDAAKKIVLLLKIPSNVWSDADYASARKENPTRLDKVILIDRVIHKEHDRGSVIPHFYIWKNPWVSYFDESVWGMINDLSKEEQQMEKSFVEIRKENRLVKLQPPRPGLVPKVVPIEREGKIFRGIRWVRPGEELKTPTGVRIPPAWKDVWVTAKKDNPLQAFGKDSKGRTQYLYSTEHSKKAASEKFSRAKVFAKTLPSIMKQVQKDLTKHEEALVLYLIYKTGFRIGKEGETLAAKKAYGASTLLPEHITINGDEINFNFVGKKGVQINKTIEDAVLAKELNKRLKKKDDKIFDVEYTDILDYLREVSGKPFNIKDFRTWMGTNVALEKIKTMRMPDSEKEFKIFRHEVAQEVATELGNTYAVALSAYINPEIFVIWESKLAEKGIAIKKSNNIEWQTLDDMFETVQYDESESEEIEEEPEVDDEVPEKYWDYEENGYLEKTELEKHLQGHHDQSKHGDTKSNPLPDASQELYDYQWTKLERPVKLIQRINTPNNAAEANVGFRLENAGDAFREIAKPNFSSKEYIEEKLGRIEQSLKDSEWRKPLSSEAQNALVNLKKIISEAPAKTERHKAVQKLMLDIADRNLDAIAQDIQQIRNKPIDLDISKLQPPRPGLVPQTGDYEHPFRWIRPSDIEGAKVSQTTASDVLVESSIKLDVPEFWEDKIKNALVQLPAQDLSRIKQVVVFNNKNMKKKIWPIVRRLPEYVQHEASWNEIKEDFSEEGSSTQSEIGTILIGEKNVQNVGVFKLNFQPIDDATHNFIHEVGHLLDDEIVWPDKRNRNAVYKLQGFAKKTKKAVSEYALTASAHEFFAENYAAYWQPDGWRWLKENFPEFIIFLESLYDKSGYGLNKESIEKSRVAYHEHDGWQEHPVRVGDHQKYFAGEGSDIKQTSSKEWPVLVSTKKITTESVKKVFSEIPQKWQDLIYEDPTPLEVKENTRTNGGLYSGHVISINPILFQYGSAKVETTYPGVKGDNFGEIVLLHEFAHAIFFSLVENDFLRKAWADASREYGIWKEKGQLITKYSSEGAHEFFAECVVYYLRAPKILKQVHPTVFAFFDKYFSKQQIEKQDENNEEFEPGLGAWWFETEEGFDKLLAENEELEKETGEEFEIKNADMPLSVKAIILDDFGRLLLLQNDPKITQFEFDLPGGHADDKKDESLIEALTRELKEETNLDLVDAGQFDTETEVKIGTDNHLCLFFKVIASGPIKTGKEHLGYSWVFPDDLDMLDLGAFEEPLKEFFGAVKDIKKYDTFTAHPIADIIAPVEREEEIDKSKVAFHEHEGFAEHPVAVKDHNEYLNDVLSGKPEAINFVSFKSRKQASDWEKEKFDAWKNSLSNETKSTIRRYVNQDYSFVNRALRRGDPHNSKIVNDVRRLDSALAKAIIPENIVVWRGMNLNVSEWKLGDIFEEAAYVSTSLIQTVALRATNGPEQGVLLKINVPNGTHGAGLGELGLTQNKRTEAEILLARNQRFRIKSIEDVVLSHPDDKSVKIHPKLITLDLIKEENLKLSFDGGIIALVPVEEIAKQLEVPNGIPWNEMHITLAYIKYPWNSDPTKIVKDLDIPKFEGKISGYERFTGQKDKEALVALIDVPGLDNWRTQLTGKLIDAGFSLSDFYSFKPHITLAYLDKDQEYMVDYSSEVSEEFSKIPIIFKSIEVWKGEDKKVIVALNEHDEENIKKSDFPDAYTTEIYSWIDQEIDKINIVIAKRGNKVLVKLEEKSHELV